MLLQASRGIGSAIALRCHIHPKLPGTIYTAAKQIEEVGGKPLPITCDVWLEEEVTEVSDKTVSKFGGIDIVMNNA